jgi:hypothetical protein
MDSMFYRRHRFLGGIKHFWWPWGYRSRASFWRTLYVKNRRNLRPTWRLSWSMIDIWQPQWSVVSWIWITKLSTTFWPRNWASGHLDAASRLRFRSHCHLRERSFDRKEYSSGFSDPYSHDLSPCNFFLFPKLKFHLKSRHFGNVDNIQKVAIDQLRALPYEDLQQSL